MWPDINSEDLTAPEIEYLDATKLMTRRELYDYRSYQRWPAADEDEREAIRRDLQLIHREVERRRDLLLWRTK